MIRARFFVAGTPATQGSKRIVQPKGHRRPMLLEQTSKKLGPWRAAVEAEAMQARQRCGTINKGVLVTLLFVFKRPKRPANDYPTADLDKLCRAAFDALVRGRLLADDRHIRKLVASKDWNDFGGGSGLHVEISDA